MMNKKTNIVLNTFLVLVLLGLGFLVGATLTEQEVPSFMQTESQFSLSAQEAGKNRGQLKKLFSDVTLTKPAAKASMSNKPSPDPGHLKKPDGTPATAGSKKILVYPRAQHVVQQQVGTYRDVDNVQWAVDNVASEGEVILMTTDPADSVKKAFYFGDDSNARDYIYISQPVTITGEQLSSAQSLALPKGGTLSSDRAAIYGGGGLGYIGGTFNIDSSGKVTVDGVRFDNSGAAAILVNNCNGADIKNNVITNIKPESIGTYFGFGILVNGIFGQLPSGTINITNNKIDSYGSMDPVIPNASPLFGAGIGVSDTYADADIYIKQNTIKNPGASAIWLAGFENSEIWVENNTIQQRANVTEYSHKWGNGILSDGHGATGTWIDPGKVHILNNNFSGIVPNWASAAYWYGTFLGDWALYTSSAIMIAGPEGDSAFSYGSEIKNNTFAGNAHNAIFAWYTGLLEISDNVYSAFNETGAAKVFLFYTFFNSVDEDSLNCDDILSVAFDFGAWSLVYNPYNFISAGGVASCPAPTVLP